MSSLRPMEPNRSGGEPLHVPQSSQKEKNSVSDIRNRSISQPSGFKQIDGKESADFTYRLASQTEGNVFKKIWKLFQQTFFPTEQDKKELELKNLSRESNRLIKKYDRLIKINETTINTLEMQLYTGKSIYEKIHSTGKGIEEIDKKEKAQLNLMQHEIGLAYQQLVINKMRIEEITKESKNLEIPHETDAILAQIDNMESREKVNHEFSYLLELIYEAGSRITGPEYQERISDHLQTLLSELMRNQGGKGIIGDNAKKKLMPIISSEFPALKEKAQFVFNRIPSVLLMETVDQLNLKAAESPTGTTMPPPRTPEPEPYRQIPPAPMDERITPPPEPRPIPRAPNVGRTIPPPTPEPEPPRDYRE